MAYSTENRTLITWHRSLDLERCVRLAIFPDAPEFLMRYLSLCEEMRDWSVHKRAFFVLLATVRDERLPGHWRRLCLDYAYKPLVQMRLVATNQKERVEITQCETELRQLSNHVI